MYAREYRSTRPHKAIFFHLSCLTLICSAQVYAKPDMRPLGPNIAIKAPCFTISASPLSTLSMAHAIIGYGRPCRIQPHRHRVTRFYICLTVTQLWIARMTNCSNNCQKNTASDRGCRVSDQPPFRSQQQGLRLYASSRKQKTDLHSGHFSRKSGGSNNFRQLLETRIAPKSGTGTEYRSATPRLMGHSYGGLFVLDSSLSSSYFRSYYSASPSLGRGYDALLSRVTAVEPLQFCAKHRR